jgi:hypothetical protein
MTRFLDKGSFFVILLTLLLFVVALFTKGLTHDLLLEAGVFLVSVKLIIASYRARVTEIELNDKLDRIIARMERLERPSG